MRALALITVAAAGSAEASCRQALVLALDVSGSVDGREYALQIDGVAAALDSAPVRDALFAFPEAPVSLAIFEWSSSSYQYAILDWTALGTPQDLDRVIDHLTGWVRQPSPEATAIGAALTHAADLFAGGPVCWRYTLDISGDGKNNDWPTLRDVKADNVLTGVTVNALAIGMDRELRGDDRGVGIGELAAYFAAEVIQGPDAFVETALGFEAYGDAMERKLLRELSVLTLGAVDPTRGHAPIIPSRYTGSDHPRTVRPWSAPD